MSVIQVKSQVPQIAFVNASVGFSDRRKSKPIGLAYIMSYLRKNGFQSTGFDFGDSEDDPVLLAKRYKLNRFDVIGFSVYNESFRAAVAMASWIKDNKPDVLIVLGGPHATAVHEHIARKYKCFDVIVRREGEEVMLQLLQSLGNLTALRRIESTTWRHPGKDTLIINPDRTLVRNLDELPFPDADFISHSGYPPLTYYDEVQGKLKSALTICSSRSCPYDCSFCGVLTIGRKYRSRKSERVAEELLYFRKRHEVHYEHIYFSDANFFVSPKRALLIAESLHQLDSNISFSFGTRVNQILRAKDVLPALKNCGLRFIELGIESASPSVLKRLAKGVSPEVNVEAVRLLKRLDIEISLDFIMLDQASTLDDIALNLRFLRENGFYDYMPHDHLYSALVLYEGTPIRKFYEKRLGCNFDPDELPSPFTMFEQPEVQRFSDEVRKFRQVWQERIDTVLARAELAAVSAAQDENAPATTLAQIQLDSIALRHAPNLFFETLLSDALAGFPMIEAHGSDAIIPKIGFDRISLEQMLERVESTTQTLLTEGLEETPTLSAGYGR